MQSYVQGDKNIQQLLTCNQKHMIASKQIFNQKGKITLSAWNNSQTNDKSEFHQQKDQSLQIKCDSQIVMQSPNYLGSVRKRGSAKIVILEPQISLKMLSIQKQEAKNDEKTLMLSNKNIKQLNEKLFSHHQFEMIDMSYNSIRSIDQIETFQNLRILKLQHNQLRSLPNNLDYLLPRLEWLNISNNFIQSINKLPQNLQAFYISFNMISVFPKTLPSDLKVFHIQGNPISYLQPLDPQLEEFAIEWHRYTIQKEILRGPDLDQFKLWLNSTKERTFEQYVKFTCGDFYDFNKTDILKRSIIHQAVLRDELGIIVGCQNVADMNQIDHNGMTPLFLSIKEEYYKSAKFLLNCGSDPNVQNQKFGCVLSLAITMLNKGANPNLQDKDGNTPLHYIFALWKDQPEYILAANQLISHGACSNIKNNSGYAPLHMCIRKGFTAAIKYTIKFSIQELLVSLKQLTYKCHHNFDLNIRAVKGNKTAIGLAIQFNVPQILIYLMDENLDLDGENQYYQNSTISTKLFRKKYQNYMKNIFFGEDHLKKIQYKGYCCFSQNQNYDQIEQKNSQFQQKEKPISCDVRQQQINKNPQQQNNFKEYRCINKGKSRKDNKIISTGIFVQGFNGDSVVNSFSSVSQVNDSKSEKINTKKIIVNKSILEGLGSKAIFRFPGDMKKPNEINQLSNVISYSGLRAPKLHPTGETQIFAIQQRLENVVSYCLTTANHYKNEFKQTDDPFLKLKYLLLLYKLQIQFEATCRLTMKERLMCQQIPNLKLLKLQVNPLDNQNQLRQIPLIIRNLSVEIIDSISNILNEQQKDYEQQSMIMDEAECQFSKSIQESNLKEQIKEKDKLILSFESDCVSKGYNLKEWDQKYIESSFKQLKQHVLIEKIITIHRVFDQSKEIFKPYKNLISSVHQFEVLQTPNLGDVKKLTSPTNTAMTQTTLGFLSARNQNK